MSAATQLFVANLPRENPAGGGMIPPRPPSFRRARTTGTLPAGSSSLSSHERQTTAAALPQRATPHDQPKAKALQRHATSDSISDASLSPQRLAPPRTVLSRKHSDASSLSSTPTKRRPRTALSSKHRAAAAIAERAILTKRNHRHARRRQNQHALPAFVSLADIVAATDATALDALGPGFAGYAKDGGGFYRTALASHASGDEPVAPAATNDYAAALHALDATDDGVFATMEGIAEGEHNGHAYHGKRSLAPPAGKKMRRIMREVTQDLPRQAAELLGESATGAVFVRADEDRPQYLRAVLTGLEGTPYHNGAFVFDIFLPPTYPDKPLMMTHVTKGAKDIKANNGPGGFSPNLHRSTGKVCLSLLGTWKGPGWDPKRSNVYQALSTLLWMVLGAENPYYMEPNHGGWEGTAPTGPNAKHPARVVEYRERVQVGTARYAILGQLRAPWPGFERVLRAHFLAKRGEILGTLAGWARRMVSPAHKGAMRGLVDDVAAALDEAEEAEARASWSAEQGDGDESGGGGDGQPEAAQGDIAIADRVIAIRRGRVAAAARVLALLRHLRDGLDAELLALLALRSRAVEAWRREHGSAARQEAKVRSLLKECCATLDRTIAVLGVGGGDGGGGGGGDVSKSDGGGDGGGDDGDSLFIDQLFQEDEPASAAAAAEADEDDGGAPPEAYAKYVLMVKVGVPVEAAALKMKLDAACHPPAVPLSAAGLKRELVKAGVKASVLVRAAAFGATALKKGPAAVPAAPKCTAFAEEVRALAARITKGVAPLVAKAARTLARRREALAEAEAERAAAVAAAAAAAAFDRAVAEEADPAAAATRLLPAPADLLVAVPTRGDVVVGKLKRSASAAVIASVLEGVTLKPVDDEWDGTTLPLFHDIPGDSTTFDALAQFQRRNKKSKRPKSAPSLRGCFGAAQRPNAVNLHQYQAGGGADEEVKKTSQQPAIKEAVKEELSKGKVSCVIS